MISDAVLTAPADVLVLPMADDLSAAVALASELRAGGLRVQIYSENKKFKAKIGYADKLGIPFVIFLGEDEIAQHVDRIAVLSAAHVLMSGTPREVFARADELVAAGLDVPQVTRVAMALRAKGLPIDPAVYTVAELKAALLALRKGGAVC